MASIVNKIDLSVLPGNAVDLLMDFYEFLVEKYSFSVDKSIKKEARNTRIDNFISNSVEVDEIIIPSREELYERKSVC